jgi:uncharacterized protein (TIGR03067 family)
MDSFMAGLMPFGLLAGPDIQDGRAALQGKWTVLSVQRGGKIDEHFQGALRTIDGDRYTLALRNGETLRGTLTVDPEARTLDMRVANGEFEGKTLRGIYEITGEVLKLCFAEPGRDRPTDFKSTPGSGTVLVLQERVR